jgi:hypothetical protein
VTIVSVVDVRVPRGQTVNGQFYLEVMKRLRQSEGRGLRGGETRPGCCTTIMHLLTREFLAKNETIVIPQPPYSPDLAPADFFLFPKLKSTLKGHRFPKIEENSPWDLCAIPQNAFLNWKKRWKRCINSGGKYFEGDKSY